MTKSQRAILFLLASVFIMVLYINSHRPLIPFGLWIDMHYSNQIHVTNQDIPPYQNPYLQKLHRLRKFNITPVLLDPVSLMWLNKAKRNISVRGLESPTVIGVENLEFLRLPAVVRKATVIKSTLPKEIYKRKDRSIVCVKLNIGRTRYLLLVLHQTSYFTFLPACNSFQDVTTGPWIPNPGTHPLVFDRLSLSTFSFHGLSLVVPNNISKYLLEFPYSIYIKCRRETPDNKYDNEQPSVTKTRLKGAVYLKEKLQNLGRFPIVASGSLLGWYRQCDFIRGTGDFDYHLLSSELDKNLHISICNDTNITGRSLNLPTDGFQYFLWVLKTRIDLFFLYGTDKKDILSGAGFIPPNRHLGWYYRRSKKCSGVLLGHRFNVPCEINAAMLYEYGKDWMKKPRKWEYANENNFRKLQPYPKSKLPYVYVDIKHGNKLLQFFKS